MKELHWSLESGKVCEGREHYKEFLLAQEIIRYINAINKNINIVVKIDITKAYDWV